MDVIEFREFCLAKKRVTEEFPFDRVTLVFKVMGKMFAVTRLNDGESFKITLKCNPELAIELREKHDCIEGAFHFNKKYWNSLTIDGSLSDDEIKHQINHSYDEVVKKLTKKDKELLGSL
ncbi:MAG: MmcQ/YjbR family DNA-binding protein [Bacteroidales bacterium]|nr:MmcQ/YjbR family DNA-binding protein [Bacteroidales bacterium]MDY0217132.1 MmcQ/YjbR family DNA-binding protein [Bacteroidales bacterium]